MKPIVFLDIDGVLNTSKNYAEWNSARTTSMADADEDPWVSVYDDPHVLRLFDKNLVELLNKITRASGAQIVVSSSWRQFYSAKPQILIGILKRAGVEAEVLGFTPTWEYGRWEAIDLWLYQNRKETGSNMVILDDFDASLHRLNKFLVQTHAYYGLRAQDVDRALEKISGDPWTVDGYF